jgi:hypothetical protein
MTSVVGLSVVLWPPPIRLSALALDEVLGVGLGQGDAGGLDRSSDPQSLSLSLSSSSLLLLLSSSLLSKPSIGSMLSSISLRTQRQAPERHRQCQSG